MKISETLIAWTPATANSPTAGTVKVGPLIKAGTQDWAAPYLMTGGAAYTAVRKLSGIDAVARVFIEFNTLVARDGLPVGEVHEAFLAIDEYATHIAPDMPGARDAEDGTVSVWQE